MPAAEPYRIKTIGEFHHLLGLPRPEHPLISVINLEEVKQFSEKIRASRILDFYAISLKHHANGNFKYGQQQYHVQEGVMYFIAPGQVCGPMGTSETNLSKTSGWALYVHPDFLWNTPLANGIKKYGYFNYSVDEALHLSEKEEKMIIGILKHIEQEYHSNTDRFSDSVIIAQVELLLTYSERFYNRQFLTHKKKNHQLLDRLEGLLTAHFNDDTFLKSGIPTVQYVAEKLNVSPNYLSGLLKALTGKSTQQHIQDKLIDKAKEKLSTTDLSVSEIAYQLGFEYPQSFSTLFKTKTRQSPLEFRQSFN